MSVAHSDSNPSHGLSGKRIIFVLGSLELGGAEHQASILARYLSEQERAIVEVWGFNHDGPVRLICEQNGLACRVVSYPFVGNIGKRLAHLAKFAWLLRRARPDILLSYTLIPNIACGLVWRWTGAQLCVWNQRDEGIGVCDSALERRSVKRVSQFISNSKQGARFLVDGLKAPATKVAVIRNGIKLAVPGMDRFAWRDRLQLDDRTFVACMVANLHQHKDHKTLLKAWPEVVRGLKAQGRPAVLVLAGKCDDAYKSLSALARELGLTHQLRFLGQVSDVAGLLGAVDLSVLSSRSEGCPNGVLESMASGLAVAGTDTPGIRETLGPANSAFLAPPGDARALAEIILKLANDPVLCATIGAQNQSRVRSEYVELRMCEETVSLLLKSIDRRSESVEVR